MYINQVFWDFWILPSKALPMPAYHSALNELQCAEVCGFSLLPLKTRSRGPAPPCPDDQEDVVDEILSLFRANVLFTNYEIKGGADRVLVYGTLFTHMCLKRLEKCNTKSDALRQLTQVVADSFAIPGEPSFPLGGLVKMASNASESETIRGYLKQLREALAMRLIEIVYVDGTRSKWWMFFSKRKFMNKELQK
jgi:actin related protein 2/3 complex subunit 3